MSDRHIALEQAIATPAGPDTSAAPLTVTLDSNALADLRQDLSAGDAFLGPSASAGPTFMPRVTGVVDPPTAHV
jgi:hypothetical protein